MMLQRMSYNQVSLSLLKYYFSIILFLSITPSFDFLDVCESKSLTCQCGEANSSYPLHLVIKQCPRIYRWEPYCGDCKDQPSDDQRCSIYRNCLECEPDLNKCLKCPAGKYGIWCTGECQICANGGSCHRETGICQCPEGFFGSTCQNNLGCQPPVSHINGGKAVGWTTKYSTGATITYECNKGYEMEGQATLHCLENGLWSQQPPNCLVTKATIPDISPVKKDEPEKINKICKPKSLTCQCGRKLSEVIHQVKQCEITVANEKKCGSCKDEPTDDEQCALYRNCDKCETNLNQCQDCVPGKFGKWCNETEVRYCPVIKITHDDKLSVKHNPPKPLTDEPKKSSKSAVSRIRIAKGPRLSYSRSRQLKARSALPKEFVDVATEAEFSCNSAFYELDKPTLSLCLPSGEWSKRPPSCIPKCGISGNANPRIHYGKQSHYGQWPWQVALSELNPTSGKWEVNCGGSVISNSLVLTAAHCVTVGKSNITKPSFTINLHFAKHHRNDTADIHTFSQLVEKIYTHPNYNPVTLDSDIALIRIKPISFMYFVQPVCLPNDQYGDEGLEQDNEGIVIGWGMMEDNNTSEILRQVKLPIVTNNNCQNNYKKISIVITNNMLCAGHKYGKYASCKGDSGGPLMFQKYPETNKWVQEGIVSFGSPEGCGEKRRYSVFTRVRRFIDWINWVKQLN